jgi:hypothetical protein
MRPIRGLERPSLQWALVAACLIVTLLAAAEAVLLRRARAANEALHAANLEARLDRQQLDLTLGRERAAREALSQRGVPAAAAPTATLTLEPVRARGATAPPPTIDAPAPDRIVELRLQLPAAADRRPLSYAIALRDWSTGQVRWSRSGLVARVIDSRPQVTATLTGDVLAPGPYEVALTAIGADGATVEVASYDAGVRAPAR